MTTNNDKSETQEITLKEVFLTLGNYFKEIKSKWSIILLFVIVGLGYSFYKHFTYKNTYIADYRFLIESPENSGGLNSLIGSFGFGGGGKNKGRFGFDKINEIIQSTKFVINLLNSPCGEERVVDYIMSEYKLLSDKKTLEGNIDSLIFDIKSPDEEITISQSIALKKFKVLLWKGLGGYEPLISFSKGESKVYLIRSNTKSEELSYAISSNLFKILREFLDVDIRLKQIESSNYLKSKIDSLKQVQNIKLYQIARAKDRSYNVYSKESKVSNEILKHELMAVNSTYSEFVKNYELTKLQLANLKDIFVTLEKPYYPLFQNRSSLKRTIIFGFFSGLVIGIVFIIGRKFYSDIMRN